MDILQPTYPFVLLAIDPGYAACGYAVLIVPEPGKALQCSASGTLTTTPKESFQVRLARMYDYIDELIDQYHPDVVAMEQFFVFQGKNGSTVAQARGAIVTAVGKHNLPIVEISPKKVKECIHGNGQESSKLLVQEAVTRILGLQYFKFDDESDACAIGIIIGQAMQGGYLDQFIPQPKVKKKKTPSKKVSDDVKEKKKPASRQKKAVKEVSVV